MGERDASAAPADWELLSLSMSASTFADPNPIPDLDSSSAKTDAPKSLFIYPVLDDSRNPNPSAHDTSNWTHEGSSGDNSNKIVGGHMPQQSAPPFLHVHDGGHGYIEENISYPEPDAESLLQADPFMAASQDLTIDAAECLLVISSTNMGTDRAPRKKARGSRSAKVVWTIAVSATIVGIVMLGRRLQAELYQNQQLHLELSIKDEKLDDLTHQVSSLKSSLKDVLSRHYTARSSTF